MACSLGPVEYACKIFVFSDFCYVIIIIKNWNSIISKKIIYKYSNLHGLPSPMRMRDESELIIYLPTYLNYVTY